MVTLQSPAFNSLPSSSPEPQFRFFTTKKHVGKTPCLKVKASSGRSHCDFRSLNTPLEPRTQVGKILSGVLQNHRQLFHIVAKEELKLLSDDRDSAVARIFLCHGDEELLHRRIANLKKKECDIAVEDVMYMLILHKFSQIRAPLVPKISSCIYNGRLEILPSKDWELETLHNPEVLDIVREYTSFVTGLKANPSVNEIWATTTTHKSWLRQVYVASILYGYLLKSVSLRYDLERSLSLSTHDPSFSAGVYSSGFEDIFGQKKSPAQYVCQGFSQEEKIEGLKCYVKSFHTLSLKRCCTLRSKEAVNLVRSHSEALFGKEKSDSDDGDDDVLTSFSSMRRLVLEAIAFGSFLWEAEDYIESVYELEEHHGPV